MEDLDFLLHKGINPFVRRNKNEKSPLCREKAYKKNRVFDNRYK